MNGSNRTEFEAWINKEYFSDGKISDKYRASSVKDIAFSAWQAARAQPERVALSDAVRDALSQVVIDLDHNAPAASIALQRVRAILSAQADGPVIDYGTKYATPPITQPLIAEAARDDAGWCKPDRPWSEYPIGTKARESWSAGFWIKTERGWKWPLGSTFPIPGGSDQVLVAAFKRDDVAGDAEQFKKLSSDMLYAADEMDRLRIGDGEAGDDEAHRLDRTVAAIEYHNAKNAIRTAISASKEAK